MRPERGIALFEMMVYIAFFALAAGAAAAAWNALYGTTSAVARAHDDLETAERFLQEWKDDVRRADRVRVSPDELVLGFDGAADVVYRCASPERGVERLSDDDLREYGGAFAWLAFGEDGRLVAVDLELRRSEGGSFRPRLGARVHPSRRREGP